MNESEYHDLIDDTFIAIEDALEALDSEIEYETAAGILTLYFPNGSKIIINRQPPVQQLWIAARSGGFHLNYDPTQTTWVTDNAQGAELQGQPLFPLLSRLCSEHAGRPVELSPL
jgi:CyaY protein